MKEKDKIKEELDGLSPLLSKMKEEGGQPFRAPEGYFQGLPDEVLRRARAEEGLIRENRAAPAGAGRTAWWQWLLAPRHAVSLATALLLIAAGAYLFRPQPAGIDPAEALAGISEEEAEAYVCENIGEFELELMLEASVVSADDVPEMKVLPDIDQKELDLYLEDLIDDISLDELEEIL
ncbi:MAG: hypothetical protein J5I94_10515 [Phaeodactylibacter sp.]|nr:hypothetical protein [Phaeodactylibacter sp.]